MRIEYYYINNDNSNIYKELNLEIFSTLVL